ncbi:L-threonine 3-dehydrogenase [Fusibacter sp. JL298sf-3]
MKKILITGAGGQIGTELTERLRREYGVDNVVATNVVSNVNEVVEKNGIFEELDVTDGQKLHDLIKKYNIDTVMNLAAILSAVGENKPQLLWDVNMNGLYNCLEVARETGAMIFTPSSIAAFGPNTPKDLTPQDTIQRPSTIYGVSKVAGELLCDYYYKRFGVDTRGVRFPGLISYAALPGGGTTDYAVHIYYEALKNKKFTCNLAHDTYMDMMYMPDALDSIVQLSEADPSKLIHRNAFNITAMSFCPEDMKTAIQKHIPEFELDYNVDEVKQNIANSWPNSLDDSAARAEWGWNPKYDLDKMTQDMMDKLRVKLGL